MGKLRVAAYSVSLDGFGAGPRQDLENPIGVRGLELHAWFLKTAAFRNMHHLVEGSEAGCVSTTACQGTWLRERVRGRIHSSECGTSGAKHFRSPDRGT